MGITKKITSAILALTVCGQLNIFEGGQLLIASNPGAGDRGILTFATKTAYMQGAMNITFINSSHHTVSVYGRDEDGGVSSCTLQPMGERGRITLAIGKLFSITADGMHPQSYILEADSRHYFNIMNDLTLQLAPAIEQAEADWAQIIFTKSEGFPAVVEYVKDGTTYKVHIKNETVYVPADCGTEFFITTRAGRRTYIAPDARSNYVIHSDGTVDISLY